MKFKTTAMVPREVEVEFKYYPPVRGERDSLGGKPGAGPPLGPADPEELELLCLDDCATGDVYDPGNLDVSEYYRLSELALKFVSKQRA